MTRVNGNVHPSEIVNKHLQGEFFEIRRVRIYKPDPIKFNKFKLGTGHVKFYSTQRSTTFLRLNDISIEMLKRGLGNQESIDKTKQLFIDAWGHEHCHFENTYQYTDAENDMVRSRLAASLLKMYSKKPVQMYYKETKTLHEAISLLNFSTEKGLSIKASLLEQMLHYTPEQILIERKDELFNPIY